MTMLCGRTVGCWRARGVEWSDAARRITGLATWASVGPWGRRSASGSPFATARSVAASSDTVRCGAGPAMRVSARSVVASMRWLESSSRWVAWGRREMTMLCGPTVGRWRRRARCRVAGDVGVGRPVGSPVGVRFAGRDGAIGCCVVGHRSVRGRAGAVGPLGCRVDALVGSGFAVGGVGEAGDDDAVWSHGWPAGAARRGVEWPARWVSVGRSTRRSSARSPLTARSVAASSETVRCGAGPAMRVSARSVVASMRWLDSGLRSMAWGRREMTMLCGRTVGCWRRRARGVEWPGTWVSVGRSTRRSSARSPLSVPARPVVASSATARRTTGPATRASVDPPMCRSGNDSPAVSTRRE